MDRDSRAGSVPNVYQRLRSRSIITVTRMRFTLAHTAKCAGRFDYAGRPEGTAGCVMSTDLVPSAPGSPAHLRVDTGKLV